MQYCSLLKAYKVYIISLAGAEATESATLCADVAPDAPTILVMGSESTGLRTTVKNACTGFVRINSFAEKEDEAPAGLDSLNVSVAAAVLLHQLLSARTRMQ